MLISKFFPVLKLGTGLVLAIMALLCRACGRGFEQQDLEE